MFKEILTQEFNKIKNSKLAFHILKTSFFVGLITVSYKCLYVIRDLLVAWTFGRSQFLDAFILTFIIPFSFVNALSESLVMTFLPHFIELREKGEYKEANEVYSRLLGVFLFVSLIVMTLLVLTAPVYSSYIASSFRRENFSVINLLIYFTAPAALLNGVAILWKAILNAKNMFLQSSFCSVTTPLVSIILLLSMKELDISVLAIGLLIGISLELILLAIFLKTQNFKLLPSLTVFSANARLSISDWWRAFISLSLFNSMVLVNSFMAARRAEVGGLSILSYGKKIVTLPNDISAITYSTVLLPYLSKIRATKDWGRLLRVLNRWLALVFVTTIPIVILVLMTSEEIVSFLYEHGAFTANDTKNVSKVLDFYIVQLPFFVAFYILLRVLPVIRKNSATMFFGAFGLGITILFNYIMTRFLGTSGIALATSLVYLCLATTLYIYVRRTIKLKLLDKFD